MRTLHADLAYTYAYVRMDRELASYYVFHSLVRTEHELIPTVQLLSVAACLDDERRQLLRTAAWFQDIGHIDQHDDHRLRSAQIASEALPVFGYEPSQVAVIIGLILATRMPQAPRTELELIIADADLAWLGQTDFVEQNERLRMELMHTGVVLSDHAWLERLLGLLQSHRYHTSVARELYDTQKQANLRALEERIAQTPRAQAGVVGPQGQFGSGKHPLEYLWRADTRPDISLMIRELGALNS
jgi:uncharacterized protein